MLSQILTSHLRDISSSLPACIISPLVCFWHHIDWEDEHKHSLSTGCMCGHALGMAVMKTNRWHTPFSQGAPGEEADLPALWWVQQQACSKLPEAQGRGQLCRGLWKVDILEMGTAKLGLGPQVPLRPVRRAFQAEGLCAKACAGTGQA